jgi:predicted nucleotidyltransferase
MRLSDDQARAIVTATRELAGPRARVRLFGSRLRDDARGGDVDFGGGSTSSCKQLQPLP